MKSQLKFKRGDFITQFNHSNSFAIFGGDEYEPISDGSGIDYSLICYYNDAHYIQNSSGGWTKESVFEYDLNEDETCEYTINENDLHYWRICTEEEKDNALRMLAFKRLAWIETVKKFRKLGTNEQLVFGEGKKPTSNVTRQIGHSGPYHSTNPLYNNEASKRKLITTLVKDSWEQKEPITCMDDERKKLVASQCFELRFAFNSYGCGGYYGVIYPQNGSQIPLRNASGCQYDNDDNIQYGMNAYRELMRGTEDYYDEL